MDTSGEEQSDEQQAEIPIGIEEQKTIESQEAEAVQEKPMQDVSEPSPTTMEEIIGKAQEENNPQTTGPAEKLREEAAENVDEK
jgi:hypothetical protein